MDRPDDIEMAVNDLDCSETNANDTPNNGDTQLVLGKRKRHASDSTDSDENECKRSVSKRTATATAAPTTAKRTFELMDFSDEMLFAIIEHLGSVGMYEFSKTCTRMLRLINDRRLWSKFDFSHKSMTCRQTKVLLQMIPEALVGITEFKICGLIADNSPVHQRNPTITRNMLSTLREQCPHLTALEIHEGFVDFRKFTLTHFPPTLRRLVFNDCRIPLPRTTRLFTQIDEAMPLLEELSLEKCSWFETHDLVVFSKLPQLKRLILRGCTSLRSCVPYGSIASRFGFTQLEYLDVRETPISDSDIQCFNITRTLREILMDCPEHMRVPSPDGTNHTSGPSPSSAQRSPLTSRLLPQLGNQHPAQAPRQYIPLVQRLPAKYFRNGGYNTSEDESDGEAGYAMIHSSSDDDSDMESDKNGRSHKSKPDGIDDSDLDSDDDGHDDDNNDNDDGMDGGRGNCAGLGVSYPDDVRPYGHSNDTDSEYNPDEDDETSAGANGSEAPNRHYIQVILQNGRLMNITNEPPPGSANQAAEDSNAPSSSLRCVIGLRRGNQEQREQEASTSNASDGEQRTATVNVRTRHQELILGGPSAQQLFIRGPNAREALAIAAQEAQNVRDAQEANAQPANSTDESVDNKTDDLVPGEADANNSNRDIVSTSTSSRIVIEASPTNQADIDAGASSQVVIEASILQRPSTAISRTEAMSNRATIKASSSASAASTSSTDITEASSSNQVVITASTSKQAVVDAPSTSKEMSVNAVASGACENEPEAGPSQPKRIQPTIGEVVPPAVENPPAEGPSRSNDFGQQLIVVHQRLPHEDESGAQVSGHIELHVNPNLQDICDQSLSTMNRSHISDRCLCSFGMPRRNVQDGIVWIRAEMRPVDTLLERITVRNYRSVTDITLRHLVQCAPNLQYLDVTGTSITIRGIRAFLKCKPNVEVVSDLPF